MREKEQKIPPTLRQRLTRGASQPKDSVARGHGVSARERTRLIGYGLPPKHSRWKTGESGNPKGRPKGSKNILTVLREIGRRKITNPADGRRYSYYELAGLRLFNEAARGNISAIRLVLSTASDAEVTHNTVAPGRLPPKEQDLRAIRKLLLAQLPETDSDGDDR